MTYDDILRHYWPHGQWTVTEGPSGWNNTTRYIEAEGRKWVLRIYAPHTDPDKVRFEHAVLRALNERRLPFAVPDPVPAEDAGDTFVRLSDGTERIACLFPYREGERPPERDPIAAHAIGAAAATLSEALATLAVDGMPGYLPYYELDAAYPRCTPESVAAFCALPPEPFAAEAGRLRAIGQALEGIRSALQRLRDLPHQLIHGDINTSNLLGGRTITAVLDFEFCTRDVRAMELAVIATGFLAEAEDASGDEDVNADLALIEAMLQGFGSRLKLSREEAEVIPLLASLRKLDVFLHFLGRYWDGIDDSGVVLTQLRATDVGLKRLAGIDERFRQACLEYLT